ncbi:MAG: replication initiator, partial [Mycobacterium sp.]
RGVLAARPAAPTPPRQRRRQGRRIAVRPAPPVGAHARFRRPFSTKSRRYPTTLRALREARQLWRRAKHRTADHAEDETTLIVGALTYACTGWRTTGDALLANTAAAQAREHRRIAREELQSQQAA